MQPNEIETRRQLIRLPLKKLAPLVPLSENALGDVLRCRTSPHPVTQQAIERAVLGEEVRLRDYLLELHPLQAGDKPA